MCSIRSQNLETVDQVHYMLAARIIIRLAGEPSKSLNLMALIREARDYNLQGDGTPTYKCC